MVLPKVECNTPLCLNNANGRCQLSEITIYSGECQDYEDGWKED